MTSSASKCASAFFSNHPRQNSATAAFPSTRRPSGAGDVSSKTVSSVSNAATPSASCRLNAALNLSTADRVACSSDCPLSVLAITTSLSEHNPANKSTEQVTTNSCRPEELMRIPSSLACVNNSESAPHPSRFSKVTDKLVILSEVFVRDQRTKTQSKDPCNLHRSSVLPRVSIQIIRQ